MDSEVDATFLRLGESWADAPNLLIADFFGPLHR